MTYEAFQASLTRPAPPAHLPPALCALWHDARHGWDAAHDLAQDDTSRDGAWVHAYLHRKEGDPGNAGYWYARAGRPVASGSLPAEWEAMVRALLAATQS